jgi:branched-chain amino acid transport system ATP-binding protein
VSSVSVTATAAPVLAARGLGWVVGGAVILADVDLDVRDGELLAIIGPNGAGKSTLLHLLSGVRHPTSGTVELGGRDVTRASAAARARHGLGRTFQTSSLFGGLSARENVRLAVQSRRAGPLSVLRGAQGRAELAESDALLEQVRMTHRSGATAGELSHGDKRKLEIAIALARRPSVLLLDEPMAGVSVEDVPPLVELVGGLRAAGVSVGMVEHHMDVVLGLADRVAVLHHGSLLAVGSPAEVTADATVQQAYLGEEL